MATIDLYGADNSAALQRKLEARIAQDMARRGIQLQQTQQQATQPVVGRDYITADNSAAIQRALEEKIAQHKQQRAQTQTQAQPQSQPAPQAQPVQQAQPQSQPVQQTKPQSQPVQQTKPQSQPVQQTKPVQQATQNKTPQEMAMGYLTALQSMFPQSSSSITVAQDAYANRGTPYLDIAQAYEDSARANLSAQEQAMAKQLAASKQGTNASYNSAAAGNYINYMKQQNALPEQLVRQGINGGASESAMTRIGNNYAMNQGNTTAQRIAALAQLQSAYDTNLANMRNTAEENIMNNRLALQQSQVQYDDTLAQRAAEEARYREEVERRARERIEDFAADALARYEGYDRDDSLWNRNVEREDSLYNRDTAREDELRNLTWAREDKQRAEDNAREDARYEYEKQAAAQQNAQAEAWRQAEWQKAQIDQQIEQFAAGLLQYTDVKQLQNLRNEVMAVNPNWANDPLLYGYVMAFNNRIGVVKAEQAAAKAAKKK